MRIVINAASAKMGGAVTYLTNLLQFLPTPESGHEFEVFLPHEIFLQQANLTKNISLHPTDIGRASWWKRVWWEQVTLRQWLKRAKAQALFSTANFGMIGCPVRQLLLVRDALYFSWRYEKELLFKHPLRWKMRFKLRRWLIAASVKSADIVMTPTRAMLDDLRRCVEVEPRKALVNPYGKSPVERIHLHGSRRSIELRERPQVRLVFVSLYSEHKNLTTLLRAIPLLNKDGRLEFSVTTTANPAWEGGAWTVTHEADLALSREPAVAPWVHFVGPLGKQQLEDLYRQGDIFVFPSLCESFGHPLVEAMARGLPIVAAHTQVNREICADAAIYFAPLSAENLAHQVARVAADAALRANLVAAGARRAADHFRWDEHVQAVVESFEPSESRRRVASRTALEGA
jgi:glycosyltransferase involved in cell wall biosynthesis